MARFRSFTRRKLRLWPANHRPGYWSNLPCDWPCIAWAYSEQEPGMWLAEHSLSLHRARDRKLAQIDPWHDRIGDLLSAVSRHASLRHSSQTSPRNFASPFTLHGPNFTQPQWHSDVKSKFLWSMGEADQDTTSKVYQVNDENVEIWVWPTLSLKRKCCHLEEISWLAALKVVVLATVGAAINGIFIKSSTWHFRFSGCQWKVSHFLRTLCRRAALRAHSIHVIYAVKIVPTVAYTTLYIYIDYSQHNSNW